MTPDELAVIDGRSETFPKYGEETAWIADAFLDRRALLAEVRTLKRQLAAAGADTRRQIQSILAGLQG